ncbi:MAG TPA: AAA family ATPase [Rhodocyclaceae bacterium]|nr:AAA family ATPase [Rhodocyclaceae bacterium]
MTNNSVFLNGVALAHYRGVGEAPAYIGPFQRFNFMIGPNNAGKSCALHFIANHLKPLVTTMDRFDRNPVALTALDVHVGSFKSQVKMGVGVPAAFLRTAVIQAWKERSPNLGSAGDETVDAILSLLGKDQIWLKRSDDKSTWSLFDGDLDPKAIAAKHGGLRWQQIWGALTGRGSGDMIAHWIPETLRSIIEKCSLDIPDISLIPAIREVSEKGLEFVGWNGNGLIDELARLQNPGVHERDRLSKFNRINLFLRVVTQTEDACLEVPHDREHILVHMNGKVLPLASLGTGIHEVVMLSAFCTLMEKQIVCIEEPEIHLHPILQRRFIQYLSDNTDNQYFIATHSASIIDSLDAAVFHVTNEDGETRFSACTSSAERFNVCRDLGYKASDLLQTNSIVWVEGPSDRIYVRHWISAVDPELREGIHYSIMFYGGRLLSHLSADEPEAIQADIDALIAVRQLNRNVAVVIDSDRTAVRESINNTKTRVKAELTDHGGMAWITEGREIENYVSKELMSEALAECYPARFASRSKTGQYDYVLPFKSKEGVTVKEVDKVRVAKTVCTKPANLDVLDLRDRVSELVALIRHANV